MILNETRIKTAITRKLDDLRDDMLKRNWMNDDDIKGMFKEVKISIEREFK